jgi:hypothetical protein
MRQLSMASTKPPHPSPPLEGSEPLVLWLLVSDGADSWVFEFPRVSEKIVTVGSSEECPIRIEDLPPVAFYVERSGPAFLLVCGYPLDLRLNAKRVADSEIIVDKGIVEFGRFRFVLQVFDQRPKNSTRSRRSNSVPPTDASATTDSAAESSAHVADTRIIPALRRDEESFSPTQRESVFESTGGDFDSTQVMGSMADPNIWSPACAPYRDSPSDPAPSDPAPSDPAPCCDTLPEGVSLSELEVPYVSSGSETSRAESLYQRYAARNCASPAIETRRQADRGAAASSRQTYVVRRLFRETANAAKPGHRGSALHRLGLFMQQRPLWTVLASSLGALLMPFVLLGLERCLAHAGQELELLKVDPQGPRPNSTFHLSFEARNTEEGPIDHVAFGTNGRILGETGAAGHVDVVLRAEGGSMLALEITCPHGYRNPPPLQVALVPAEKDTCSPTRIPVVARCERP